MICQASVMIKFDLAIDFFFAICIYSQMSSQKFCTYSTQGEFVCRDPTPAQQQHQHQHQHHQHQHQHKSVNDMLIRQEMVKETFTSRAPQYSNIIDDTPTNVKMNEMPGFISAFASQFESVPSK